MLPAAPPRVGASLFSALRSSLGRAGTASGQMGVLTLVTSGRSPAGKPWEPEGWGGGSSWSWPGAPCGPKAYEGHNLWDMWLPGHQAQGVNRAHPPGPRVSLENQGGDVCMQTPRRHCGKELEQLAGWGSMPKWLGALETRDRRGRLAFCSTWAQRPVLAVWWPGVRLPACWGLRPEL